MAKRTAYWAEEPAYRKIPIGGHVYPIKEYEDPDWLDGTQTSYVTEGIYWAKLADITYDNNLYQWAFDLDGRPGLLADEPHAGKTPRQSDITPWEIDSKMYEVVRRHGRYIEGLPYRVYGWTGQEYGSPEASLTEWINQLLSRSVAVDELAHVGLSMLIGESFTVTVERSLGRNVVTGCNLLPGYVPRKAPISEDESKVIRAEISSACQMFLEEGKWPQKQTYEQSTTQWWDYIVDNYRIQRAEYERRTRPFTWTYSETCIHIDVNEDDIGPYIPDIHD